MTCDRQKDRKTEKQRDRQTDRQADRLTKVIIELLAASKITGSGIGFLSARSVPIYAITQTYADLLYEF